MPDCNTPAENELVDRAKRLMSSYEDMAELIRLGAYRVGADPAVDEAIHYHDALDGFLTQQKSEHTDIAQTYSMLAEILEMPDPASVGWGPAPP